MTPACIGRNTTQSLCLVSERYNINARMHLADTQYTVTVHITFFSVLYIYNRSCTYATAMSPPECQAASPTKCNNGTFGKTKDTISSSIMQLINWGTHDDYIYSDMARMSYRAQGPNYDDTSSHELAAWRRAYIISSKLHACCGSRVL